MTTVIEILGHIDCAPTSARIRVRPYAAIESFRPGMELQFRCGDCVRVGTAKVAFVEASVAVLGFSSNLNALIPTIAEGDEIVEWVMPCRKCTCRLCSSKATSVVDGIDYEAEYCRVRDLLVAANEKLRTGSAQPTKCPQCGKPMLQAAWPCGDCLESDLNKSEAEIRANEREACAKECAGAGDEMGARRLRWAARCAPAVMGRCPDCTIEDGACPAHVASAAAGLKANEAHDVCTCGHQRSVHKDVWCDYGPPCECGGFVPRLQRSKQSRDNRGERE